MRGKLWVFSNIEKYQHNTHVGFFEPAFICSNLIGFRKHLTTMLFQSKFFQNILFHCHSTVSIVIERQTNSTVKSGYWLILLVSNKSGVKIISVASLTWILLEFSRTQIGDIKRFVSPKSCPLHFVAVHVYLIYIICFVWGIFWLCNDDRKSWLVSSLISSSIHLFL